MCTFESTALPYLCCSITPSRRNNLRVHRLNRRRRAVKQRNLKADIEIKNMKLYKENQIIREENDKLRKKALLLHQENQALLSRLQNKLAAQLKLKTSK